MLRTFATVALLAATSLISPAKAQEPATVSPPTLTPQAQTTPDQVASACIQNRAETLPMPFTDVSPNDWAFKAVMTMYYCGAFRCCGTTGSVSINDAVTEPAATTAD